MNSFRHLEKGLSQEIERQTQLLEDGEKVEQQTVHFDVATGEIHPLRSKERAHDYRYFPEPDLVPLLASEEFVAKVEAEMPELPAARAERFMRDLDLPAYDAQVITSSRELSDFFEESVDLFNNAKMVSNWVMGELLAYLNRAGLELAESKVTPARLADLLKMVDSGEINVKTGKDVFAEMCRTGAAAADIVAERGLGQISDTAELEAIIASVIESNPAQVEQFRSGKDKVISFFVGQVMKQTQGRANPQLVNQLLREKLIA